MPLSSGRTNHLRSWFLSGLVDEHGAHLGPHAKRATSTASWWRVMCLSGLDYFSTLGYQPAIAFLAAGILSPLATLVLVLITLFGALPIYRHVAQENQTGSGSIALLEKLLSWWNAKIFVLVLLGFAATDFMITITLSAADATAHLRENPFTPLWVSEHHLATTLILIGGLATLFLIGLREAIQLAVVFVMTFLALNTIVVTVSFIHIFQNPIVFTNWWHALTTTHSNIFTTIAIIFIIFPKLALGLSGFEAGASIIPHIKVHADKPPDTQQERTKAAKRLLTTAAVIMSFFLLTSSFATTLLIPAEQFQPGQAANGRALAYLAHEYLGDGFGSLYDISTIVVLWFAGASAMSGLLNLVPRYLPRYGMAPHWVRAVRPLVLLFTAIAFLVTFIFDANVDAQAGAYATGVLVVMTSAAFAVTLSSWRKNHKKRTLFFSFIFCIFVYTTIANIIERPDGLRIAIFFIFGILTFSLVSRVGRSFELRTTSITFNKTALDFILQDAETSEIHLIAHRPDHGSFDEYATKNRDERKFSHIPERAETLFLEIHTNDSSNFEEDITVEGRIMFGYRVLHVESANVPNTIAAVLLEIRNQTHIVPTIYFQWSEKSPLHNMMRYLITGTGAISSVTREVLRQAEKDPKKRPSIHVS